MNKLKVVKILSCVVFAFAFCFILIGYAAVQDTLLVDGTVAVDGWYYKDKFSYLDTAGYSIDTDGNMTISYEYYDPIARKNYRVTGIAENGFSSTSFSGRNSIESVKIPKEVTVIGENAFVGCQNLKSYTVEAGNENYTAKDGILYNKDLTHLIHYPRNRDSVEIFEIPDTVTEISAKAFDSNKSLLAILATDKVPYMEEANWGAQSRTVVIDNRLGVDITEITHDGTNHTVLLSDTTIVRSEITQTGSSGTSYDEVIDDTVDTEHIVLKSQGNKWLVLERSVKYAYAILDSNFVLHIYNNDKEIPQKDSVLSEGVTVRDVFRTPSNVPGTKELVSVEDSWRILAQTPGIQNQYGWLIHEVKAVIVEDEITPTVLDSWFADFRGCTSFDIEKMDTSRVTSMKSLFNNCWVVTSLDVTHFDTTHVTAMDNMFSACDLLTELDLSSFSNENLKSIGSMLSAKKLQTVYVGDKWLPSSTMTGAPFSNSTNLTGSKGTIFSSGANTAAYARIDFDEGLPGYLTYRGYPLVRMAIDGIEITSVTPSDGGGAVVTLSEKPGDFVRIVSSLRGVSDTYLAVKYNDGVYQIELPESYYQPDQLVSVCDVGVMLFACLDNGTLYVYQRQIGIDNENGEISFADGQTEKKYSLSQVFSTSITVDGVQNIGQPIWTNASSKIERLVIVDEIKPKNSAATMFANLTACKEFDLQNMDFSNVTTMYAMFQKCSSLTSIKWADDINTSSLTNMSAMFIDCTSMDGNLLPEYINMSKVTTVEKLYYGCTALTNLVMYESFDTSIVNTMQDMFCKCTSLKEITWSKNFDTKNVKRMDSMFSYCESIETITLPETFNTENCTVMSNMFGFCYKLKNLTFERGVFNTSKVTSFGGLFRSCYALTDEDFEKIFTYFTETTALTNIGAIFNSCTGLKNFVWPAVINTEKVTYMRETFQYCSNLETVDLVNMSTAMCDNTQQFFNGCKNLTTIYMDESWNVEQVTTDSAMFSDCNKLVGGYGTSFNDIRATDKLYYHLVKYAVIDGVNGQPGYLTAPEHDHEYDESTVEGFADGVHGIYCKVFGEPISTEPHTYNEDHKCTVCGYVCQHGTLGNFASYPDSVTATTHVGDCVYCLQKGETEEHGFSGGKCVDCDYKCLHNVTECVSSDADKHKGTCTICKLQVTETHEYSNGICVKCGYKCKHPSSVLTPDADNTTHSQKCTVCGNSVGAAEEHTFVENKCACGLERLEDGTAFELTVWNSSTDSYYVFNATEGAVWGTDWCNSTDNSAEYQVGLVGNSDIQCIKTSDQIPLIICINDAEHPVDPTAKISSLNKYVIYTEEEVKSALGITD